MRLQLTLVHVGLQLAGKADLVAAQLDILLHECGATASVDGHACRRAGGCKPPNWGASHIVFRQGDIGRACCHACVLQLG